MRRAGLAVAFTALLNASAAHALDPATAPGQYIARSWGTAHGLPQSSVTALAQTPDGYVWVGTRAGLVRFDGVAFRALPASSPVDLSQRWVTALFADRAGALWIAAGGSHVLRWRGGRLDHFGPDAGVVEGLIAFHQPAGGAVLAGGWLAGVRRFDGGGWVRDDPRALVDASVLGLASDGQGTTWLATHGGLARVRDGQASTVDVGGRASMNAALVDRDGAVWAGGDHGLFRVEGGAARRVFDDVAVVEKLLQDRHGNLWIGTHRGLYRSDGARAVRCDASAALATARVTAMLEDREGSLWVGLEEGGLAQLKDGALVRVTDEHGASLATTAIVEDRDGSVWIGTEGGGLARLRGRALDRFGAGEGVPPSVSALALDADGAVWIGGRGAQPLVVRRDGELARASPRSPSDVRALAGDGAGGVWMATSAHGLAHARAGELEWRRKTSGLDDDAVSALYRDRAGRLWVGQLHGVVWLEGGQRAGAWRHPASAYVTAFHEDAAGDLWVGSGIGLARHRGGQWRVYYARDGLYADAITGMTEDRHGRLWLCSRKGIFHVRKSDFDDLDRGAIRRVTSVRQAASEGMNALECPDNHAPTAWAARDGRLWFATLAGAVRVDPDAPVPVGSPPLIEELSVDGRAADLAPEVVLPPGTRRLQFSFTAPAFLAPEAVAFRYRLDGFDADWVLAGATRQAEYTRLPPRAYRFRVAAAGEDGHWREAAPLSLRLRPHLWQTAPFYVGCVLLALAIAAAWLRARVRRVQARLAVVIAERDRISRELHDNLSGRLLGLKLQLDAASRQVATAPEAARAALDEARAELPRSLAETRRAIWMLRSEALARGTLIEALGESARQITAGTETQASVTTEGAARALPADVEEPLLRIAQEALGNAVRHGAARRVEVRVAFEPGAVRLQIDDDGRGLPAEAPGAGEGHYGLVGMRERARLAGGVVEVGARPGGGTRVGVRVPLGMARLWRRIAG